MSKRKSKSVKGTQRKPESAGPAVSSSRGKKRWQEPKLGFVEPKLTKHGELEEVTGQFFGPFSPGGNSETEL